MSDGWKPLSAIFVANHVAKSKTIDSERISGTHQTQPLRQSSRAFLYPYVVIMEIFFNFHGKVCNVAMKDLMQFISFLPLSTAFFTIAILLSKRNKEKYRFFPETQSFLSASTFANDSIFDFVRSTRFLAGPFRDLIFPAPISFLSHSFLIAN